MYMILSKMFDWFINKNKRLQSKIDKYIELENQKQILKSQVDECAQDFIERKTSLDELIKSESDQSIKDSVQERYDNYVSGYIVEIGDLKRNRDRIESEMNNLIKGDEDFLNLVKKEKEVRKFKSILSKYRSSDIDLDACDALIKAVSKKKVDYADNLVFNEKGELLLLKRSELDESKPGYYTIPGGHVDSGEDFETAAKRELLEEAGIKSENVTEVGKYEDDKVCIHYFRSDVVNVEPVLQEEEVWSYEWVDPKEIDKYKLPFNMGENITKILYPIKHQIINIKKSFENGLINEEQKDVLLDVVLEKAKSKYELKLEKQAIRKKDPDFFVEKYHEWNNQSEVPSYSKPSAGSVLEFFQNNYEDFSNDDELKEIVLKRLNKSEEDELNTIEFNELNKAFEEKYIDEQTYDSLLEKAWKKQPIGTVTTRKDGKKYRKVSETGNMDQDWKLVNKDKTWMAKDESKRNSEAKQVETKSNKENLQESAKNTSETALNNAIKQSPDPEVRQAAHEELQRRESEEKSNEEEKDSMNDLDKLEEIKQNLLKKVDELSKLHKKLYSNMDIESPKSEEEKKSEKEIANIFSEINSIVLKKRNIIKEKGVKKSEEIDLEKAKDQIKGGLADNLSIEQIAEKHGVSVKSIKKQIKVGKKVEMEHVNDKGKAEEISKDHLTEDPKYYTRLAKMEDEAKKENKKDE